MRLSLSTHFGFKGVLYALSFVAWSLAGCTPQEQPGGGGNGGNTTVAVTEVSLNQTSLTLTVGGTASLTATVSPSNATDKTVSWSSSNTSVATVSDGTVTAVAAGSATITAKAGGKSATCSVTVNAKEVPVTGISLDPTSVSIQVGKTATLTATVTPSDATNATVSWSSSNTSVATVSDGTVTAVSEGTATITATAGGKSATGSVTVTPSVESQIVTALLKIYDAMDGPHWNMETRWSKSTPLKDWSYVEWNPATDELHLDFWDYSEGKLIGLKGEFPDCFDELPQLTKFHVSNESGVTGTVPPSFSKLKNLVYFDVRQTSMTRLADVFNGIPLKTVYISGNKLMTGPLPESLGSSKAMKKLYVAGNNFTGTVPDSWAQLGTRLLLNLEPSLDGRVPDSFVHAKDADYLINMYLSSTEERTTPNEVGDYDIPAYVPREELIDLVSGKAIPFRQIFAKNKNTILLNWGTWCPFSKQLMPVLKRMYEKYHKDGLEIIAGFNATVDELHAGTDNLKGILQELGYDQWYNFSMWDLQDLGWDIWSNATPSAVIVDKDGNILSSSRDNVSDPSRNRFGYTASAFLIPLLESTFGPLDGDDGYSSTDYSQDGKVITIQKASVGKGINLVFMGDAYTDKDIASGLYEQMMQACVNEFFSIEPYKSFRNRFNIYAVKVVSKNGKTGTGYTTALGAQIAHGAATAGDADKVYQYALKVPGISSKDNLTVGVIVNSIYHGGIANLNETHQSGIGYFSSMSNDPTSFGSTLRHETGGHAFGFLADEYATQNTSPTQATINDYTRLYHAYGWYSNIDFTSDPKKVKWSNFLSDSRYKDELGVYEGAVNVTKGAYRPSVNSMMNQNMEYFNAPSRWAIYKRIMELSGETASFSKFLEYDAINRGSKPANAPRTRAGDAWEPDAMPVISR